MYMGVGAPSSFTTNFPATENPISQGGIWLGGATDGLDWNDVKTTGGQAVGAAFVSGYNDPSAILKSSYFSVSNDQFAEGVVYRASGYTPSANYHEIQLRLRFSISAHDAHGYEILFALDNTGSSNDGWAVVKWLGSLGSYTTISSNGATLVGKINDGDVFRAELRGSTMKVFRNSVQLGSDIDMTLGGTLSMWNSGQPGIGMFPQTPGCTLDSLGWKQFTCGNLS